VGTKFLIPCEVKAVLQLIGNFETGKLVLQLRNVEHFGSAEYVLSAEAVTKESLHELSQFILGETRQIARCYENRLTVYRGQRALRQRLALPAQFRDKPAGNPMDGCGTVTMPT